MQKRINTHRSITILASCELFSKRRELIIIIMIVALCSMGVVQCSSLFSPMHISGHFIFILEDKEIYTEIYLKRGGTMRIFARK